MHSLFIETVHGDIQVFGYWFIDRSVKHQFSNRALIIGNVRGSARYKVLFNSGKIENVMQKKEFKMYLMKKSKLKDTLNFHNPSATFQR